MIPVNSLLAVVPLADMPVFEAPDIHWAALSPMLIVMVGGLLGMVAEAFVPQRSRGRIQIAIALVAVLAAFGALLTLTDSGRDLVERTTAALNTEVFSSPGLDAEDANALVGIVARLRKNAGDFTDPRPMPDPL